MYKSAQRFLQRAPASKFWKEYVTTYHLKSINTEEVLMSALSDTFTSHIGRSGIKFLSDYELAGLVLICYMRAQSTKIGDRVAADLDARIEREGELISFSDNERSFYEVTLVDAAKRWKKT